MHTDPVEILTPADTLPVTLGELKSHLQLNRADDDVDLTLYLAAAHGLFEFETSRALITTTFTQYSAFPRGRTPIRLARGKATSITAITYAPVGGGTATLTGFVPDLVAPIGYVYPPATGWPAVDPLSPRPVQVRFVAGWPTAAAVPPDAKVAVRQLAAHYYGHRDAYEAGSLDETPDGFRRVCNRYRLDMGIV
ncbi:head-tail connector protein [Limnoglobus roseus]|uniref:Phage gp6-like head-tail connector protein n=1 Tax=Limnoglobus roseus TaxID=2598579 RepID=A0A5C1AMV6_9BACT|nr:hypothetical protein [Limnoglobus roseus]QEL18534.1 hypothetical protein PX52LOC_05561 [Limnoglobus roseus]